MKRIALSAFAAVLGMGLTSTAQETTSAPQQQVLTETVKEEKSDYSLVLGFKSYNDTGRGRDYSNPDGLRAKSKEELYVGFKHSSGWGTYYNGVYSLESHAGSGVSKAAQGDPSIALLHPDYYNDGRIKHSGYMKMYYPVTDRSRDLGIYQYSYYLQTTVKNAIGDFDLLNIFTPRYFDDRSKKASNTHYFFEDISFLSRRYNSWIKYGVGQHTQYEAHFGTSPGLSTEVFPFMEFWIGSKSFISPRISLPVVARNSVYDGPRNATLEEARAQVYLQLGI